MHRYWDEHRGNIRTQKGGWVIGRGVYISGYSLLDDLVGNVSYFQSLILNVTGELPSEPIGRWVEALYQCMSFPDSRIWCNQIGTLGGTLRVSSAAGITAGILASDSRMYGPGTISLVYDFLSKGLLEYAEGKGVSEIIRNKVGTKQKQVVIPGYGRPLATGDERVVAMERVSKELDLVAGPSLQFAYAVEQYIQETQGESMNLAAYLVSGMMDLGWTLPQIQQICAIIVTSGVAACYSEAYDNPPESFLPLRCEDIEYRGHAPRPVPEVGKEGGD
ncbi:MAG TPA: hypothetical protein ENJ17_02655 [Gammaproteobacteria bacterium]|nr:hypothetical protein [Gammaproteobacteria bacterium]